MSVLYKCLIFEFNNTYNYTNYLYNNVKPLINNDNVYIYLYISLLFFLMLNKLDIPIIF